MHTRRPALPHVPRARVDPIVRLDDALAVIEFAVTRPLRHETVVLFLDVERRGHGVSVVDGSTSPDSVVDVATCVAAAVDDVGEVDGVVIVSVRPGDVVSDDDVERWHELRLLCADHGLELVDWIVLGRHGPEMPRTLVGGPDPWRP